METSGLFDLNVFLFRRISVVVQRFNSILLNGGLLDDDRIENSALFHFYSIFEPQCFRWKEN